MKTIIPRDRSWAKSLAGMLLAVALGLSCVLFSRTQALAERDTALHAVYSHAISESGELSESIAVNLNKLLVTGDPGEAEILLSAISRDAEGVVANLSLLPLGAAEIAPALKFVNQTGDAARTLSAALSETESFTREQWELLETLSARAEEFSESLKALNGRWSAGGAVFTAGEPAQGSDLSPLTDEAGRYPTLLYDGPFADARGGQEYRMLEGGESLTEEETRRRLRDALDAVEAEITFVAESELPVPAREYLITSEGAVMTAAVTVQGGHLLYLLPENSGGEERLAPAECMALAEKYLARMDYGEMTASYYSFADGILTANFAAVTGGVILYPDLVKVQVSMSTGEVVGLEATGYLMNHRAREIGEPVLTEADAMAGVSDRLAPEEARLCLISQGAEELLCWEVRAAGDDGEYLVYLNAATGAEEEIFRLLYSDGGVLVI